MEGRCMSMNIATKTFTEVTKVTPHIITRPDIRLPLIEAREDGKNIPTFITIHETSLGLSKVPGTKNAEHYISLLENPKGDPRVGYHFLCGDDKVYQLLETWVRTAHAGSTEGNSSIAIERLVNSDIDYDRAINNQARLTATLMFMYNIPIENVVPHQFWSGKECPARLIAGMYRWNWGRFIRTVDSYYSSEEFIGGIDQNLPNCVYDFLEDRKREAEEAKVAEEAKLKDEISAD